DFPELGVDLGNRFNELSGLRQLIVNRKWHVIYEIDLPRSTVWILAIQNCRQKLPPQRKLRKQKP
ncbi:MAG TPA: hypothetical protein VGJ02_08565, partial [Pyrinomonadaceae bacterium]